MKELIGFCIGMFGTISVGALLMAAFWRRYHR